MGTPVAGYNSRFYISSLPSVAFTNEAMTSSDLTIYTVSNSAKRYFDKDTPVVVQSSPDGSAWTTITTGFTLYRVNARVVFGTAQPAGTQIRFASGNYLPYSQLGGAKSCELAGKIAMLEDTVFGTPGGAKTYVPGLFEGTMKTGTWWANRARVQSLVARDLLIVDFELADGGRYEGYAFASSTNIKSAVDALMEEELEFQLTDEFFAA